MACENKKRVVVTGIGLITPLGVGLEATWEALVAGKSGIGPITQFDASEFKTRIAAEVSDFNPEDFIDKKTARRQDRFIQFASAAAGMAMKDSGLKVTEDNADRIGCVMGCGLGGLRTLESTYDTMKTKGPDRISPFFIPMIIGNLAPGQISIDWGLKGPNLCLSTACAAGTHGIGQGYHLVRNGVCSAVVCGGVESTISELGIGGFNAMKALSTRNDDPEKASRPFDKDRDGFVVGEGSGVLILEELESAVARGAKIYAEAAGFGMSGDAHHMTAPAEDGAVNCMKAALKDAGMKPEDIVYINAHGTSTQLNDSNETKAIKTLFGEHAYKLAISSTKSMTGHLLGGAGGIEGAFTALSIYNGVIPPTINLETPDPECDLDYVPHEARKVVIKTAMSNSFGFGGTNGTLIFKAYES